jgi:hypothetical protein
MQLIVIQRGILKRAECIGGTLQSSQMFVFEQLDAICAFRLFTPQFLRAGVKQCECGSTLGL